jgi:predicted nucleic acid-binding protein
MMYLLDTDTTIYNMKGFAAVKNNLLIHYNSPIKISIVTLMELYYGAYKSQKVAANLAKIRELEQSFEIIPLNMESVVIFGRIKAQLETKGIRLDDFDLMLASCALSHGLIFVTNNMKHFERIEGLKLDNWAI